MKLVPYLKQRRKLQISSDDHAIIQKKNQTLKESTLSRFNRTAPNRFLLSTALQEFAQTTYEYNLFTEHTIVLFDEKKCKTVLLDQDLLLVRFVQKAEASKDCPLNSFVIVTKQQISVFDPQKHEVARISNMNIGSALLINSMYIYIMEERCGSVLEQYAYKDTDWELTKSKEIQRNCIKAEEGCISINF